MVASTEEVHPDQIRLVKQWAEGDGPGREEYCCFETIIERIAATANLSLDADAYVLAGGKLRERWPHGSSAWRNGPALEFQRDDRAAATLAYEIIRWASCSAHLGIAHHWAEHVFARVSPEHRSIVEALLDPTPALRWGPSDAHDVAKIAKQTSVLYALWRPDADFNPVGRVPLYIGTAYSLWHRWQGNKKSHIWWWGGGRVVITAVQGASAMAAERAIISALCPFTNISANRLHGVWRPFFASLRVSE
jgi:hypothetical protein